jgi:hypothetical protein
MSTGRRGVGPRGRWGDVSKPENDALIQVCSVSNSWGLMPAISAPSLVGVEGAREGEGDSKVEVLGMRVSRCQRGDLGEGANLVCNGEGVGAVRVLRAPAFSKGDGLGVESVSKRRVSIVVQAAARGPGSGFANVKPSREAG